VRVAPAGLEPSGDDAGAAHVKVFYAITPCDDHRTLDFWAVGRDFAVDDLSLDVAVAEMNRNVVLQDVACLNLIAERAVSETTPDEVSFKIDAGGLAARRVLQAQIARERRQPGG
jgi:vanillate O-demethylase monooxygenase subunit